LDRKIIFIR